MTMLLIFLHCFIFLGVFDMVMAVDLLSMQNDKIVVSIDRNEKNPSWKLQIVHKLFEFRTIRSDKEVTKDSDVVSYAVLDKLKSRYSAARVPLPSYITDMTTVAKLFNNKLEWKNWMIKLGLGSAVAQSFDVSSDPSLLPYPVMMKTKAHGSKGVSIIHNATEYISKSSALKAEGMVYSLEEPLTGLGMSEVFAFGSAFRGKILSLHCGKRSFESSGDSADPTTGIFVSNVGHKFNYAEHWLACGKDLIDTIGRMLAAADISGIFCVDIKLDSKGNYKILETNVRICASHAWTDGLVLSGYVTLAFAVEKADASPTSHLHHVLYNGSFSRIFQDVRDYEHRMVETGGGQQGDKWLERNKFNADEVIDPIHVHYNPRKILAGHKILVSVAESHLATKLQRLKQTSDLFVFLPIDKYPLGNDIDLVISLHHDNLTTILRDSKIPHLLPLLLTEKTSDRLGFVNDLRPGQSHNLAMYGSAHKGALLALRCVEHTRSTLASASPGVIAHQPHQQVPCSVDVVKSVHRLFSEKGSDFSGAFCGEIGAAEGNPVSNGGVSGVNNSSRMVVKSVRGGLCPVVSLSDALFISTFVPLALALKK